MNQTCENYEKPNFGHNFGPLGPPLPPPPIFFVCFMSTSSEIDIVPSYHPMQFPGKLMNQT